ncbi:MAG: DinB family protein [Anaerolineae bacterium]
MTTQTSAQSNEPTEKLRSPDEFFERIETTYAQLLGSLEGLTDEQLITPGMTGTWSGKDVMSHIARWEETTTAAIEHHLRGERLPGDYRNYEAWNARWAEEDRDVPLNEVKRRFEESHQRLMDVLDSLSPEQWNRYVQAWLNGATWHHYEGHAGWIQEWRDRQGR